MIEFPTVAREFRSLIRRRLEIQTLLGSIFAGLGIFLQNTLQGGLPDSLGAIKRHLFAFYALLLMVPCLILGLRMARLHAGMVLNGILIARLSENRTFARPMSIPNAARHNYFGVSFLQFVLMDILAGFSTTILILALQYSVLLALVAGGSIMVLWLGLYFRFHHQASRFALRKIAEEACADFEEREWEAHQSGSLEDANHGLNAEVAFVGLIVFSVFETLSGLGQIKTSGLDLAPDLILRYGPTAYVGLMLVTCLMGMFSYLRVRVAIGKFSLIIDPADRPFRILKLTDSLLGYVVIAFLFTVSSHLFLGLLLPALGEKEGLLLTIDALIFIFLVICEQMTLVLAGRFYKHLEKSAT
ncbi:hypothetical protein P12x_004050 [Tundrisphaera lichenicola]|uniref:hypothetical protein n=1 Tax=Tundrisphaera lichenicola TaxID=2029860 RepID=UPI003EB9492D